MKYAKIKRFRKIHRFLGLFIGVQFLFWTISGLYFSWTDIDKIHGDHYKKETEPLAFDSSALLPSSLDSLAFDVHQLRLVRVGKNPFFWVNDSVLIHPSTGKIKNEISSTEALEVVQEYLLPSYSPLNIERIEEVGPHHEYRGRPLPAYKINLSGEGKPTAYVAIKSGQFQRIRHQQWRWFDFLWMTHTMDYQGRDNFNTIVLRVFSLLGLITVLSGFYLAWITRKRGKKNA